MAITITDKALEQITDYWQDDVNKYILLYKRTIVFDEDVAIQGNNVGTVIPLLSFDTLTRPNIENITK